MPVLFDTLQDENQVVINLNNTSSMLIIENEDVDELSTTVSTKRKNGFKPRSVKHKNKPKSRKSTKRKKRNSNSDFNNESEATTVVRLPRRQLSMGLAREESFMIGDLVLNINDDDETSDDQV